MITQARFCHLEFVPSYLPGDIIQRGQKIGRMGTTGKSSANHLHFDLIQCVQRHVYRLNEILTYVCDIEALLAQYSYFLRDKENELFKIKPVITSSFGDPFYTNGGKFEFHPAFDLVPENRHSDPGKNFDIFWPRSSDGHITAVGYDDAYGYYICISYEG